MPIYTFEDKNTKERWDEECTWKDRCEFLEDNPHIRTIITKAPTLVSSQYQSGPKTDQGFQERLSKIAEAHPGSELAERYGKKDPKSVGTRNAVKKWRNQQKAAQGIHLQGNKF